MTGALRSSRSWLAGIGLALLGCQTPPPAPGAGGVRGTILAWLECEECTDGELAAVVDLGADAVPTLTATLRDGMSPAPRARLVRQLSERHAARVAYGLQHPDAAPILTEQEFIDHHVENRDALYRGRSALALGLIGTPAAEEALREALARPQSPSVEQMIRDALAQLRGRAAERPLAPPTGRLARTELGAASSWRTDRLPRSQPGRWTP
jgi:hypothetical protein